MAADRPSLSGVECLVFTPDEIHIVLAANGILPSEELQLHRSLRGPLRGSHDNDAINIFTHATLSSPWSKRNRGQGDRISLAHGNLEKLKASVNIVSRPVLGLLTSNEEY